MTSDIRLKLLDNYYKKRPTLKLLEKVALMDLFMQEFFFQREPVEGSGEIIVSGYIMGDGLGDYIHMKNIARAMVEKFPKRKVVCILLSDVCHRGKIKPIGGCETIIEFAGEKTLYGPYFSKKPIFSKRVIERLYKADLLLSGPANIREPNFEAFRQHDKRKVLAITEYDYEVMGAAIPYGFKLKAGLDPNSSGIFLPPPVKKLEETFHFAYFRKKENLLKYREEVRRSNPDGKIYYILRNRKPVEEKDLVEIGPLSEEVFNQYIFSSQNPVGCTGDHSFVHAIAYGKIPFYETIGHKVDLYQNYLDMVQEVGVEKVQEVLHKEFNLAEKLKGAANWLLYKYGRKDYALQERAWMDGVLRGDIDMGQFRYLIEQEVCKKPASPLQ